MDINKFKGLMAHIYLKNGKAVRGLHDESLYDNGDVHDLALSYEQQCIDALIIFDLSLTEEEHKRHLQLIKHLVSELKVPVIAGGHINKLDDVDHFLRCGCSHVFLNMSRHDNVDLLAAASQTFGKDMIAVCINDFSTISDENDLIKEYASFALLFEDDHHLYEAVRSMPLTCVPLLTSLDYRHISVLLHNPKVMGVSFEIISNQAHDIYALKEELIHQGIQMHYREARFSWSDMKLNSDRLLPVIVQDYKNDQVLMMAYMNEEAFNKTVRSGRMTYWSRSRKQLWLKGETSGHYQIVKELFLDCDNDTILAKVEQIGAACHTGNRTCFYRSLMKNPYKEINPVSVFKDLYDNTLKENNDFISREDIVSDTTSILYHLTRLMARNGITMEEITNTIQDRNDID